MGIWALHPSQRSAKTECCRVNYQGTQSTKLQENSCTIIGICIFVLIISLQNTSSEATKDVFDIYCWHVFLHHSPKRCFACFLFCSIYYMNYPCINTVYNHFHFCYYCILNLWVILFINSFPLPCLKVIAGSAPAVPCYTTLFFSEEGPCC